MHYREIWKSAFGPIPKDKEGRSYEIHHIDGNRYNNDLCNLLCIPIEQHFHIHLQQKEYGAAALIYERMNGDPEELKKLGRLAGKSNIGRKKSKEEIERRTATRKKNGNHKQTKESILKALETKRLRGNLKHTPESIQKMKQVKKNSRFTEEAKQRSAEAISKPVLHVESGVVYKSRAEACRTLNWKQGKIAYRIKKGEFQYL